MVVILGVSAVVVATFLGFAWLARTGRRRAAAALAVLDAVWLGYLTLRYLTETYDITLVALGVVAILQLAYTVAGVLGWVFGRRGRQT